MAALVLRRVGVAAVVLTMCVIAVVAQEKDAKHSSHQDELLMENLGAQNALQTAGSIVDLVKDIQKTIYNDDGQLALVADMKDGIRKAILSTTDNTKQDSFFKAPTTEGQPEWVKQVENTWVQPLHELKLKMGESPAPSGPTVTGDLAEKINSLSAEAKTQYQSMIHRYFDEPKLDEIGNVQAAKDGQLAPFVGPTQNPLVNPELRFGNNKESDATDTNMLFPNLPFLDNAFKSFDESYSAFGDPKEWAKLKLKDRQAGPGIFERLDNYLKPESLKPKMALAQTDEPQFTNLEAGQNNAARLAARAQEKIASAMAPRTSATPSSTTKGVRAISEADFAMSEARGHVHVPTPSNAEDMLKKLAKKAEEMRAKSEKRYSIFNDPKYNPVDLDSFKGAGDMLGKAIPTTLGVGSPGKTWEADVNRELDAGWRRVNGPQQLNVPSLARAIDDAAKGLPVPKQGRRTALMSQQATNNAEDPGNPIQIPTRKPIFSEAQQSGPKQLKQLGQDLGILQPPPFASGQYLPVPTSPPGPEALKKLAGAMQESDFVRSLPPQATESVAKFAGTLQDMSPDSVQHVGGFSVPHLSDQSKQSLESLARTMHVPQNAIDSLTKPARELIPPSLAQKLTAQGRQQSGMQVLSDPISMHVAKNMRELSENAKEEMPFFDEASKIGLGQAMVNYINDQAQELAMLPKGALLPTNPTQNWFNSYVRQFGYNPAEAPIPDPQQLSKLAEMFPKPVASAENGGGAQQPQPDLELARLALKGTGLDAFVHERPKLPSEGPVVPDLQRYHAFAPIQKEIPAAVRALVGKPVVLHDFKTDVKLNGVRGSIVDGETVQGRHKVRLDDSGEVVLVKPENFNVVQAQLTRAPATRDEEFMTMGQAHGSEDQQFWNS